MRGLSKLVIACSEVLLAAVLSGQVPGAPAGANDDGIDARAAGVLEEYRSRFAARESFVAEVEVRLGKPFTDLTGDEYARFMDGLDLRADDDLWTWSHVTGITIVGLTQQSNLFYFNAHLLADTQAAARMSFAQLSELERGYDREADRLTLHGPDGRPLKLRDLPHGTVRPVSKTNGLLHDREFVAPRTVLEAIAPYLAPLAAVPNRDAIARALRSLPLSIVKAYRGKAIYMTTQTGRSYSVRMPVSTSAHIGFAGMQSGVFLDSNSAALTTHNLVHEIGHVVDYTVIKGRYGRYVHFHQFPELRSLRADKDRIFGKAGHAVPQTDYGYVSEDARANAQESFAEHFAAFILRREPFLEMARREHDAGRPELMEKFEFLEELLERTQVTTVRLSAGYLEDLREVRFVLDRLQEHRDRMTSDLERARLRLVELAKARDDRQALERLSPLRPRAAGYGILPEIAEDVQTAPLRPTERTYSLEPLIARCAPDIRDAEALADAVATGDPQQLPPAVTEFERLRGRLDYLQDQLAYHVKWQRSVVEYAPYFAERNRLVAEARRMSVLLEAGQTEAAATIGFELSDTLAPLRPTAGLRLVRTASGETTLPVTVLTDIADDGFLAAFSDAVKSTFSESQAARDRGFTLDLELRRIEPEVLYPQGPPQPGAAVNIQDHLQRFPAEALVLTTGAASTHAFTGRAVLLGPSPIARRTLAHEFAHLIGFDDAYLRGYDGRPDGDYGVVVVEWTGLTDDLMGDSNGGLVTTAMIDRLVAAYAVDPGR